MIILGKLLSKLQITKQKIIILTETSEMLELISKYLAMKNINFIQFDNHVRGEKRQIAIDAFKSSKGFFIFLCDFWAGLNGINLSTAESIIVFNLNDSIQNIEFKLSDNFTSKSKSIDIYRLITAKSYEQMFIDYLDKQESKEHISTTKIEKFLRYSAFYAFKCFDNTIKDDRKNDIDINSIISSSKRDRNIDYLYDVDEVESNDFWDEITTEKVDIEEAIQQQEKKKKEFEDELNRKQNEIKMIQKENELIGEIKKINEKINKINKQIQNYDTSNMTQFEREVKIRQLEQKKSELQNELNQKQTLYELIQKENKLIQQINDLYGQIDFYVQKIKELDTNYDNPHYNREEAIIKCENTKKELENELSQKKRKLEMIHKENKLNQQINEIYDQIISLNQQIQTLDVVDRETKNSTNNRAKTIEQQERKKKELEEELRKKQNQIETMKEEIEQRRKQEEERIKKENELKRKMKEMNDKIDSLNQQIQMFNTDRNEACLNDFDECYLIYGDGFDIEIEMINMRNQDIYPQTQDYCINLLKEQKYQQSIVISFSKKTSPHWTWFYFKPGFTQRRLDESYDMRYNVVNLGGVEYQCDEVQKVIGYNDLIREVNYIKERESHDHYPQGAYYSIDTLASAIENNQFVLMFIQKTSPY